VRGCRGGPDRDVPGAGRDVEHSLPGANRRQEILRGRLVDQLGDGRIVARGPGRPMYPLQALDGVVSPLLINPVARRCAVGVAKPAQTR
jgi:hypothetical protein